MPRPARTARRRRALLAALLALAAALPACGGGRDALVVYSGRTENLIGPLLERFNAATGTPIDVRYGDTAELALLLAEEGDRTPADVFLSQSPGATEFLATDGAFAALPDEVLELADERFRADDGTWTGVTARQRVLVWNTELLEEPDLPTSVFDVVEEPFAGRVAVAPSNGSFQDFVTALRQLAGEDEAAAWLGALAETDAPTYANNNAIVEAVSRGEVEMGLVNHYYAERFLAEDPDLPIANHRFPGDDPGSLLIASTASVLAAGDKADEAADLVAFLLGEDAQRFFADETFEYPLASGVPPRGDLPSLDELEVPDYDLGELGGGFEATLDLIRSSGLEG